MDYLRHLVEACKSLWRVDGGGRDTAEREQAKGKRLTKTFQVRPGEEATRDRQLKFSKCWMED
jgi:hypothetical protein